MHAQGEKTEFADPRRHRRITYIIVGIVILALLIVGLIGHRRNASDQAAQEKADQLLAQLTAAGLPTPSKDQITGTLGSDGGAVCDDPGNALKKGIRDGLGSNGAGGPGQRPVPIDQGLVQGELLILQVYCPDEVTQFQTYVNGLKTEDVIQ